MEVVWEWNKSENLKIYAYTAIDDKSVNKTEKKSGLSKDCEVKCHRSQVAA